MVPAKKKTTADGSLCSSVYESGYSYRCDTGGETKPCCSFPCFTRTISRLNRALLLLSLLHQDDLKTKPSPAAPLPASPGRSQDQTKPCCSFPCFTRTISRPNQALLLLSLLHQDDLKTKPSPAAPLPALPGRSQDQTKPCCSFPCFTRTISRPNQALLLLSLLYQDDLKTKPSPAAPFPALPGRSQDQTKPCCSFPCFTRTISRPNQALLLLSLLYQDDLKTKPSPAAPFPALPERSQDQTKPCCSSPCFTRTISRPNQALLLLSLLYQDDQGLQVLLRPDADRLLTPVLKCHCLWREELG